MRLEAILESVSGEGFVFKETTDVGGLLGGKEQGQKNRKTIRVRVHIQVRESKLNGFKCLCELLSPNQYRS